MSAKQTLHRTAVIDVVGLTPRLIGEHTPFLARWSAGAARARIDPVLPAVTCSVQSSFLTGVRPDRHGIVGNGWYFRDEGEVKFWRQSNRLVQAPKIWETLRRYDPTATTANLFWWYNMVSGVDIGVTPRPMYPADGRKIPDIYTKPAGLRDELQAKLGTFPLFRFWGPATSIEVSRWIVEAAKHVETTQAPTLSLVYLPHLDYGLQRHGPDLPKVAKDLRDIDAACADLIRFYEDRGVRVIVLSEYGITPVSRSVSLNRVLREEGLLAVRTEMGRELLDPGASAAFAVADHQLAHVYVNDPARLDAVRRLIQGVPGVERVLGAGEKAAAGLGHERAGDLVAVAEPDSWFTYYYWLDDRRAPDFARTVDIHRKPGYDPVELFIDPSIPLPKLRIAWTLLRKALGFRTLMEVIPLDPSLVKGSHGRLPDGEADAPLVLTRQAELLSAHRLGAPDVHDLILGHLLGAPVARAEADPLDAPAGAGWP